MGETLESCFSVYQKDVWGLSGQIDLVCNQLKIMAKFQSNVFFCGLFYVLKLIKYYTNIYIWKSWWKSFYEFCIECEIYYVFNNKSKASNVCILHLSILSRT